MSTESRQAQLDQFLGYLRVDPHNLPLLSDSIDLALDLGQTNIARGLLDSLLALQPDNPAVRYRLAVLLFQETRHADSLAITTQLIASGINVPAVRYQHAVTLNLLGQYSEAAQLLLGLQTDSANFPELPRQTIRALHGAAELNQAIEYALAHLAHTPADATIQGMLSLLYIDQGMFEEAGRLAAQALQELPQNLDALLAAGCAAVAFERHYDARPLFEQAISQRANCGRAWLGLGTTAMLDNDLPAARQHLEKTVLYMPEHLGSWITLGWTEMMSGDLDAAQATFEKAMQLNHNFAETHGGLAVVAAVRGAWEQAQQSCDIALRLQPDCLSGRFASALLAGRQGRQGEGAAMTADLLASISAPGGGDMTALLQRFARKAGRGGSVH